MRYMVVDVETRRSAQEVGGWHKAHDMGVSVAVLYDSASDAYFPFEQDALPEMFDLLARAERVVGFNIISFDYAVLQGFARFDLRSLPTLDILVHVHRQFGRRVSLDALANATLGSAKSASGMQALRWWKEGKLTEITRYCKKDVEITRDLYLHVCKHGYLCCLGKTGGQVRIPLSWA